MQAFVAKGLYRLVRKMQKLTFNVVNILILINWDDDISEADFHNMKKYINSNTFVSNTFHEFPVRTDATVTVIYR